MSRLSIRQQDSAAGGPMLKKLAFCFMILLSGIIILTAAATLYFRSEHGKKPFA